MALNPEDRDNAQKEVDALRRRQATATAYAEAQQALAKKEYDRAIGLLKEVLTHDVDFKDASRLLAEAIEFRRTARTWWQNKLLWAATSGAVVLALVWIGFRPGSPLATAIFSASAPAARIVVTGEPRLVSTTPPTAAPSPTSTPVPMGWARLNSAQFLSRDTIHAIAINPSDPGVIYVGALHAGVFKSIDGGLSWQPAQNGMEGASIDTLVIDPQQPETLYAGVYGGGLYRTSDAGANWVSYGPDFEEPGGVDSIIVIDPADRQHLYYAPNGLSFESLDGGKTWSDFNRGDSKSCPTQIGALLLDPEDQSLYANQWGPEGSCSPGVYRSRDHGRTWNLVGLEGIDSITGLFMGRDSSGAKTLIALGHSTYFSSDLGLSWKTQNFFCNTIAVDPEMDTTLYCGRSDGISKSTDGGSSWVEIPGAHGFTSIQAIAALAGASKLVVGSAEVAISADQGASWSRYDSGLAGQQVDLAIDSTNPSIFYLAYSGRDGPQCNPLYRSDDSGRTWSLISSTGCGLSFGPDGTNIYRGVIIDSGSHELFESTDQGVHWSSRAMPAGCEQVYANPFGVRQLGGNLFGKQSEYIRLFDGFRKNLAHLQRGRGTPCQQSIVLRWIRRTAGVCHPRSGFPL